MNKLSKATLLATALSVSTLAIADEYRRGGFYLSGGIGGHLTTIESKDAYDLVVLTSEDKAGLLTSVKIGSYIGPRFALYYQAESAWWGSDNSLVSGGMNGIGATVYFTNRPGMFIEFGLGLGGMSSLDDETSGSLGGAALVGFGTELNRHMQASVLLLSTSVYDTDYYSDTQYDTMSTAVKLEFKL